MNSKRQTEEGRLFNTLTAGVVVYATTVFNI
jgi:hypothetical protein